MKKNALLAFYLIFSLAGFSQKQISNFENKTEQSPNNYQFLLTFKDKVFFSAFTPETGNELWVSDGTESGTKIVKDINPGELSIYISSFAANDDYAYFLIGNKIWKTDGTSENTIEVPSPDYQNNKEYIIKLVSVNDKVLAVSDNHNESETSHNFYWIQLDDSLELWEVQILGYSTENNSIFYTKKIELNYTLFHYTDSKRELFSNLSYFGKIDQFKNDSIIYCKTYTPASDQQKQILFSINTKTKIIKKYDWGNHNENIPLYTNDEKGGFYFLKSNSFANNQDSLYLYESNSDGLKLKNKFGGENIFLQNFGTGDPFYSNVIFRKNQMIFLNGHTMYASRQCYFYVFDLEKETSSQSNFQIVDYGTVKIEENNDSTIIVKSPTLTFTYNPITKYRGELQRVDNIIRSFPFQLNKNTFELSTNLYRIKEASKEPLIKSKTIFSYPWSLNLNVLEKYKDKQLFNRNDYNEKKSELWALNKSGLKKVASHKGWYMAQTPFKVPNLSDKLFYAIRDSLKYDIFQTDGTAEGTSLYHSIPMLYHEYLTLSYNNSQIVVMRGSTKLILISEDKVITKDVDTGFVIPLKEGFYFQQYGEKGNYLYKIQSDGSLKSVLNLKFFGDNFVFDGRYYFKSDEGDMFYLNNEDKAVEIIKKINLYWQKGNLLTCRVYIDGTINEFLYTTFDLRTNKVISKIEASTDFRYFVEDDKILFFKHTYNRKDAKAYFFNGKETQEVSLGIGNIQQVKKFKNGLFIYYYILEKYKIEYYDFETKQLYFVIENSQYLDITTSPNFDFALFGKGIVTNITDYSKEYFTWSLKSRSLKKVATLKKEYFSLDEANYISSYQSEKQQFWSFENDSLIRKEPNPKNLKDVNFADIKATTVKFTEKRGSEAFAIGKDFSINFEEIVKGPEGIILNNTFIFENQFYIIASTYSHGLQIWQMTDNEKIEPLTTEEDLSIKVYPNPVQDFLTIETPTMLHYSIYSSIGQEVRQGNIENKQQINIENLSQGLYIMLFNDGKKTTSKKIIKL